MARGDRMGENYDDYLRDDNLHINWYPGHMKKTSFKLFLTKSLG